VGQFMYRLVLALAAAVATCLCTLVQAVQLLVDLLPYLVARQLERAVLCRCLLEPVAKRQEARCLSAVVQVLGVQVALSAQARLTVLWVTVARLLSAPGPAHRHPAPWLLLQERLRPAAVAISQLPLAHLLGALLEKFLPGRMVSLPRQALVRKLATLHSYRVTLLVSRALD
jgi:hypothetical protein